jgi:HupE / UreJ protein
VSPSALYIRLGFAHITDWAGYDHMLFLLALVAGLGLRQWRRVLVLVTAFTLGHALTLVLTACDLVPPVGAQVEIAIAVTILLTALRNLFLDNSAKPLGFALLNPNGIPYASYGITLAFGLIHGLGFSSYFRSLLGSGTNRVMPLLYFNIGIELGQLLVVAGILGLAWVMVEWLRMPAKWWRIGISVVAALLAVWMIAERAFVQVVG